MLRKLLIRQCVGAVRCGSARASGINFQACSFNHSDISPFRINDLQSRRHPRSGIVSDLCNVPQSLTGVSSIAAPALDRLELAFVHTVRDPHVDPRRDSLTGSCEFAGSGVRVENGAGTLVGTRLAGGCKRPPPLRKALTCGVGRAAKLPAGTSERTSRFSLKLARRVAPLDARRSLLNKNTS
jgi:hypothetical protein